VHRTRILIAACAAVVTALAWAYLFRLDRQMTLEMAAWCLRPLPGSRAPDASKLAMDMPLTALGVWFTFTMWTVMMVGMMAPAATPVVMLFASARKGRPAAALFFTLGYVAVWTGFSAAAALAQSGLHWAAMLSMAMSTMSARLGGAVLIAAGVYQLSPWKAACLTHCRSPLGFLMTNWRDGNLGAARMGFRHGVYCLGCCWALMCVLFAVGIMNLVWVAGLSVFVLAEKLGPAGGWVARAGGAAMILLGARTALLA
jgi:predicted metal-binding membrane protein